MDKQHRSLTNDLHGANVLLAPNGKPSNLTPEQYFLVRTSEFKEWFGDWERLAMSKVKDPAMDEVTLANLSKDVSKVVDQNGEPLVVYHGTNASFTIFDTDEESQNRKGGIWDAEYPDGYIFMTSNKNVAKNYGQKVIPLFVNLVYPVTKKVKKGSSLVLPFDDEGLAFEGDAIVTDGIDYIVGTQDEYQVKLADGTNTTFDSSNPDIRFDGGGEFNSEVVMNNGIYAKGGKVIAYKNESAKFKKIGIEDKYTIEAITEIGLQGFNFDKQSVEDKITQSFNDLLRSAFSDEYIISEDSQAITKQIENEIEARYNQGDTEDNIARYRGMLDNPIGRKRYIDDYAKNQKETIGEWVNYLKISEYGVPIKFLILKAVLNFNYDYKTNDLVKRNKKTIRNFTPFDAGALAELVAMDSDNLLQDYTNIQVENAVKVVKSKELIKTSEGGRWIKFDGGDNANEDVRNENAKELSKLVQNTYWCTKTNAQSQLNGGDFYVYVTESNGEVLPRIAIRMEGDEVGEVRGNKSAKQDLEDEMIPIAKEFLEKNIPNDSGKKWLNSLEYNTKAINLLQNILEKGLFKNSIEEFIELRSQEQKYLVDYASSNGNIDRLDSLVKDLIREGSLPNESYSEKEVVLDIREFDEEKTRIVVGNVNFSLGGAGRILGNIEIIGKDVNFSNSVFENLGKLKIIGGDASFHNSRIKDISSLTNIYGNADFSNCDLQSLQNIENIGENLHLTNSKIEDLGKLTNIGGHAYLSTIKDLGELKTIGKDAYFGESQIEDLKNLTQIGGKANFFYSKIKNLANLKTIGKDANFQGTKLKDLGNLESVGGGIYLEESEVEDLGKLKYVGFLNLKGTKVKSLGDLKTINGNANFEGALLEDLGNLTRIGGYARFDRSKVKSLDNLQTIGGGLSLVGSQIKSLGNLEAIGGSANLNESILEDLGNLKIIEGSIFLRGNKVKSLGNLTKIGGFFSPSDVIEDLGNLTNIGGDAYFTGTLIEDLGKLKRIGGTANFNGKVLKSLGNLTAVGKDANFQFSHIKSLGNLFYVGGDVLLERSEIVDLGNLRIVGGDVFFGDNQDMLEKLWEYQQKINRLKSELENDRLPKEVREKIEDELDAYEEAKKEMQSNGKLFKNGGNMKKVDSGGITYGASHDNGGIPVKNASTGEMLEVEGGEGIVNKRSMASDKMVKLNGKEMSICEAVSKLNQMEGGVKFSCDDVEDRQFIEEMEYGGELERGERTEMEHIKVLKDLYAKRITPKQATKQIAKDHIKENPNYYTELSKIEKKMANGGKSDCGCSHHTTTKFSQGGQSDCGCGQNRFDNGGFVRGKGTIEDLIRSKSKQGDKTKELITDTIIEARNLLDVDYLPIIKKNNFEFYNKYCVGFAHLNLYKMGWRFQFGTSREWAGLCDSRDRVEITRANLSKNKNLYVSINFVKHDANWSKNSKDVILHEIAHALVTEVFEKKMSQGALQNLDPKHFLLEGHGELWATMCKAINQDGSCSRFYANALLQESFKSYMYNCANCRTQRYSNSSTFTKNCFKCGSPVLVVKSKI